MQMPERMALAIDFLTPRATICFCSSDLALEGALLEPIVRNNRGTLEYTGLRPYRNNSTTTIRAVSRTALSASSKHATREGTYARNNKPWFLVI